MILYHYTSNETLLSVIQNKKIHLSDLKLSNDSAEGTYTFDLVKEILEEENIWTSEGFDIEPLGSVTTVLGFCLSSEEDMLSQWRAYGADGKGVCIGFKKDCLIDSMNTYNNSGKIMDLIEINYDRDFQKEKLKSLLRPGIETYRQNNPNIDILKTVEEYFIEGDLLTKLEEHSKMIFPAILELYCFKNKFFEEEKEWRLIQNVTKGMITNSHEYLEFRAKDNKIIPYREFPKIDLSEDAISEIILGPKNETPDYILETLLKKSNFTNCEIKRSSGSYQ